MLENVPLTGNVRMLPPGQASGGSDSIVNGPNPIVVNGRTYQCALGSAIDVPAFDAVVMMNNDWNCFGWGSGPTSARPTGINVVPGMLWLDTTLGAAILWDGIVWRGFNGAAV
jgi:predicted NBD/HSP70 family sugar kinase